MEPKFEFGKWVQRKERGGSGTLNIWNYQRPFKERYAWNSRATVNSKGYMEIWFNMHPEGLANPKKTERLLKDGFKKLFNVEGKSICEVFTMLGSTRVVYYCKMAKPPTKELMEKVPGLVEDCFVEAEVSRWDVKTGEFQGIYRLTDFDINTRVRILKSVNGNTDNKIKTFKEVLGSKWRFVN